MTFSGDFIFSRNASYSEPFNLGKLPHVLGTTLKDLRELNLDFPRFDISKKLFATLLEKECKSNQ